VKFEVEPGSVSVAGHVQKLLGEVLVFLGYARFKRLSQSVRHPHSIAGFFCHPLGLGFRLPPSRRGSSQGETGELSLPAALIRETEMAEKYLIEDPGQKLRKRCVWRIPWWPLPVDPESSRRGLNQKIVLKKHFAPLSGVPMSVSGSRPVYTQSRPDILLGDPAAAQPSRIQVQVAPLIRGIRNHYRMAARPANAAWWTGFATPLESPGHLRRAGPA
jgi:hypothetical protein